MKIRSRTPSRQDQSPRGPTIEANALARESGNLKPGAPAEEDTLDGNLTDRVPTITRSPDGIEVVEQSLGNAVGRWILQVRCQCGRRWFEAEAVPAATCPRCGLLVLVDIQPSGP